MAILRNSDLRQRLSVQIPSQRPYDLSSQAKMENISSFTGLSRNGLSFEALERRVLVYTTQQGEKIYYQFPGSESVRQGARAFPNDAKPVLIKNNGEQVADMDFKKIWDIIDILGNSHKADADIMGVIFLRIAYMLDYKHISCDHLFEDLDISAGTISNNGMVNLTWNCLSFDKDVIETLNDRFPLSGSDISFEAFLYYNDILAQNEDNKYYYLKGSSKEQILKNGNGRINNCLSHLTVISHVRDHIGISKLIDSFQRTGVAPLPQSRLYEACGDLVTRQ